MSAGDAPTEATGPGDLARALAGEDTISGPAVPAPRLAGPGSGSGLRFGKYEVLQEIGRGGMGIVYQARDVELDRVVALKLLPAPEGDPGEAVQRFRREARMIAQLSHPGIVAVHDVGTADGKHFYVMDYLPGEVLSAHVGRGDLSLEARLGILAQVCETVQHAHERGIVHRDLKPGNVLVAPGGKAYLLDFGLARRFESEQRLTRTGQLLGTPHYMSPEQFSEDAQRIDARSDVYSLGAMLYELLTGAPPFQGTATEVMYQVLERLPEPPSRRVRGLDPRLEWIALAALAKDPARRYAGAGALAADLRRFLAGKPVEARAPSRLRLLLWRARRRGGLAASVALLAAGLFLALLWVVPAQREAGVRAEAAERRERARVELQRLEYEADPQRALAALDRALAIDPAYVEARLERAHRLRDAGRSEEAARELDEVVRLDPRNAGAWYLRGVVRLEDLAQPDRAAEDFRRVQALDPGSPVAALAGARAHVLAGEHEAALAIYAQVRASHPELAEAHYEWARIAGWVEGRRGEAAEAYGEAFAVELRRVGGKPEAVGATYRKALLHRGAMLAQAGRGREAVESFRRYLRFDLPDGERALAFGNLVNALTQDHRYSEARAAFAEAGELARRFGLLRIARAWLLHDTGDPRGGDAEAAQAVEDEPENSLLRLRAAEFFAARIADPPALAGDPDRFERLALGQFLAAARGGGDLSAYARRPDFAPLIKYPEFLRACGK